MRGQLSAEFTLVLAIVTVALALSLTSLLEIKSKHEQAIQAIETSSAADRIAYKVDQVCTLGGSNSRTIGNLPESFSLSYAQETSEITLSAYGYFKKTIPVKCAIIAGQEEFSSSIFVKYNEEDGTVSIAQAEE